MHVTCQFLCKWTESQKTRVCLAGLEGEIKEENIYISWPQHTVVLKPSHGYTARAAKECDVGC